MTRRARVPARRIRIPARRIRVAVLASLAIAGLTLGLVGAPTPAGASCAGPAIGIGTDRPDRGQPIAPVRVIRGAELLVSGDVFVEGCADTDPGRPGCAGPVPVRETERPLRRVDLALVRGDTAWVLGVADAEQRPPYAIAWRVRIPPEFPIGPATLRAWTAEVPVVVG